VQPIADVSAVPAFSEAVPMPVQPVGMPMPVQVQRTTTAPQIDAKTMKEWERAQAEQAAALEALGAAQSKAAAAEAEGSALIAQETNRQIEEQQRRQAELRAEMETRESAAKKLEAEYQESGIDQNRIFGGSRGNQVMAALLAGMGAWNASMTGGRNYAMDVINQAVERDIEEQKIQMVKKGEASQAARREFDLVRSKYEDVDGAMRMMRFKAVEQKALGLAQKAQADVQKAALLGIAAEARQKWAIARAELSPKTSTTVTMDGTPKGEGDAARGRREKGENETTEWGNMLTNVMGAFDRAGAIGFVKGTLPQPVPGSRKGELEAEKASIGAQIVGRVPGIKSDQDYQNIVVPLLPAAGDRPETIKAKRAAFGSFLDSMAPASYLKASGRTGGRDDANPQKKYPSLEVTK
jgi:hypothetical protein